MRTSSAAFFSCIALLSLSLASAGCDSAPAVDAGNGMDAPGGFDTPPIDAPPAPACQGTPPGCALLSDTTCLDVMGCRLTRCAGFPISCARISTMGECSAQVGCSWSGTACTGTATVCGDFTDATCTTQTGCTLTGMVACRGLATACESLDAATCESQSGCTVRMDMPDAGPVDAPRDTPPPPMCEMGMPPPGCVLPEELIGFPGCNPETGIECDGDWRGTNPQTGAEFCTPGCGESECCSPRDGRFQCMPRDAGGNCPAADIFIDGSHIEGGYRVEVQDFAAGDCAIAEGCVADRGARRILRFDTWTPNVGEADLFLGATPAGGTDRPPFVFSSCHGHHHFESYAEYELLSADGCCVAATGHKQAFCLIDLSRYDTSMGSPSPVYDCSYQGIQRGYQDIYSSGLTCQWIDMTDVPPGDYVLRIRVNPEHVLLESNYDNNELRIPVTIP